MKGPQPIAKQQVIDIHDAAIRMFGGLPGLRDEGLLESALSQPWQTFDGSDLYPTVVEKGCRLAYGLIRDHPFTDGNKRVGAALLGVFLRANGVGFRPDHAEFLSIMLSVASGEASYENLLGWVREQTDSSES